MLEMIDEPTPPHASLPRPVTALSADLPPRLILVKGGLFLVLALLAAATLLAYSPNLRTALLLGITVWAFCRVYYFMFYVIEHYVDSSFRFAGIVSFLRWATNRRRSDRP